MGQGYSTWLPNTRFQFNAPTFGSSGVNPTDDLTSKISSIKTVIESNKNELINLHGSLGRTGDTTDLETINTRVKELESRVSGDSCSINHGEIFIFTYVTEVASWLEKEDVPTMGIFWDIFSVLVAMAPKRLTGKERADQQYSSDRINPTTEEKELAASMAYERPHRLCTEIKMAILFLGKKDLVAAKLMKNG